MVEKGCARACLVEMFPGLPLLALGVHLGWLALVFSGRFWASDIMTAGVSVYEIFFHMSVGGAPVLLLSGLSKRVGSVAGGGSPSVLGAFAAMCAASALSVVFAGPYFQQWVGFGEEAVAILFRVGAVVLGICSSVLLLNCGRLYGALPPRRALCYTMLSYSLSACVYFIGIAGPSVAPFEGGPSWYSIVFFAGIPAVSFWLLSLARFLPAERGVSNEEAGGGEQAAPVGMGLLARPFALLVFMSTIIAHVHMQAILCREPALTVEVNAAIMLMRLAVCACIVVLLVRMKGNGLNLGDVYAKGAALIAMLVCAVPIVGDIHLEGDLVIGLLLTIFEITVWCFLAFITYQKRVDPVRVYGLGYGSFVLGELAGCLLVNISVPAAEGTGLGSFAFNIAALALLAMCFLVFPGKDLERLTSSVGADEKALGVVLFEEGDLRAPGGPRPTPFHDAMSRIAEEYGLSAREAEVASLLAKGLSNDRVAAELCISRNTVRTHAQNIYEKSLVHSRQEFMQLVDDEVRRK